MSERRGSGVKDGNRRHTLGSRLSLGIGGEAKRVLASAEKNMKHRASYSSVSLSGNPFKGRDSIGRSPSKVVVNDENELPNNEQDANDNSLMSEDSMPEIPDAVDTSRLSVLAMGRRSSLGITAVKEVDEEEEEEEEEGNDSFDISVVVNRSQIERDLDDLGAKNEDEEVVVQEPETRLLASSESQQSIKSVHSVNQVNDQNRRRSKSEPEKITYEDTIEQERNEETHVAAPRLSIEEVLRSFREHPAATESAIQMVSATGRLIPSDFRKFVRAFKSPKHMKKQKQNQKQKQAADGERGRQSSMVNVRAYQDRNTSLDQSVSMDQSYEQSMNQSYTFDNEDTFNDNDDDDDDDGDSRRISGVSTDSNTNSAPNNNDLLAQLQQDAEGDDGFVSLQTMKIGASGAIKTMAMTANARATANKKTKSKVAKSKKQKQGKSSTSTKSNSNSSSYNSNRRMSLRQSLDMYRENGLELVEEASEEESLSMDQNQDQNQDQSLLTSVNKDEDDFNVQSAQNTQNTQSYDYDIPEVYPEDSWTQGELQRASDALKRASLGLGVAGDDTIGTADFSVMDSTMDGDNRDRSILPLDSSMFTSGFGSSHTTQQTYNRRASTGTPTSTGKPTSAVQDVLVAELKAQKNKNALLEKEKQNLARAEAARQLRLLEEARINYETQLCFDSIIRLDTQRKVIAERREKRKRRMGEIEECNRRMSISQGEGVYSPLPPSGQHNMACGGDDEADYGEDAANFAGGDHGDYDDNGGGGGDYEEQEEFYNPADVGANGYANGYIAIGSSATSTSARGGRLGRSGARVRGPKTEVVAPPLSAHKTGTLSVKPLSQMPETAFKPKNGDMSMMAPSRSDKDQDQDQDHWFAASDDYNHNHHHNSNDGYDPVDQMVGENIGGRGVSMIGFIDPATGARVSQVAFAGNFIEGSYRAIGVIILYCWHLV